MSPKDPFLREYVTVDTGLNMSTDFAKGEKERKRERDTACVHKHAHRHTHKQTQRLKKQKLCANFSRFVPALDKQAFLYRQNTVSLLQSFENEHQSRFLYLRDFLVAIYDILCAHAFVTGTS